MKIQARKADGGTLVVTIVVVMTLLVLLGAAIEYSTQISRNTQRSRKTALAMEIADGHLEYLFSSWRNIYRTTWTTVYGSNTGGTDYSLVGTNFFYTASYSASPAPTPILQMTPSATPPVIPLPPTSNFPTEANYTVTQYRIQAVDPMITLDANGNALVETQKGNNSYGPMSPDAVPPAGYGPNPAYGITGGFPYSYYYLAAADVTVPTLTGSVTAKVRRVFEKKFDLPWTYMMFYVDDLEFQPTASLSINGPVHTNSSLYIGTNYFTTTSRVEYATDYVNGYSPNDTFHTGTASAPAFAKSDPALTLSDCPPYQTSPALPFGWSLNFNPTAPNSNDGYREIIERPGTGADPLSSIRMYNQAGLRILIDAANNITATFIDGTAPTNSQLNTIKGFVTTGNASSSTLTSSYVFYDNRESGYIKTANVDVYLMTKNGPSLPNWNGVVYIADTSATLYNTDGTVRTAGTAVNVTYNGTAASTTKRGIRLINGSILPSGGLTIVSDNPVYIVGDYNTNPNGSTSGSSAPSPAPTPPSDVSTYTSPTVSGTQRYAAIYADAITLLSRNWVDTNSTGGATSNSRWAYNTTVNACLVSGIVPSSGGNYSGGGENFVRFLEDWNHNNNTFTYYGSMVQLFRSQQAVGAWTGSGNLYKAPALKWYYDSTLLTAGAPPGNLSIAAYLQQQRWYQVY